MATALTIKQNSRMSFPHAETVDDMTTGSVYFGNDGGRATSTIQVYFTSPKDFVLILREILGYSEVSGGGLSRKLPKQHPMYNWMFAERISDVKGLGLLGSNADAPSGKVQGCERVNITVAYAARPYAMVPDDKMPKVAGSELGRYVSRSKKTLTKIISTKAKELKWVVVPDGLAADIDQSVPRSVTEGSLRLTWHEVPLSFLGLNKKAKVQNFASRVGSVNEAEFEGCPAGTLLLEEPEIKTYMPAIPADAFYSEGSFPQMYADVTFPMKVFEPDPKERGDIGNPLKTGHNSRVSMTDGRGYPIGEKTTGMPIYPASDFKGLFNAN